MLLNVIIDTCSWFKLDLLDNMRLIKIDDLYDWINIEITHEVLKEIEHYAIKSFKKNETTIIPIQNKSIYHDALNCNLEPADASILSNGSRKNEVLIVSDDQELLEFAHTYHFTAIHIVDLFLLLTEIDFLSKRSLYRIAKELRNMKNISKKKHKEIHDWLLKN